MDRICFRRGDPPAALAQREWLVTNGLGGYASGTIGGRPTRRFHGYLIASLPPPLGRMVLLNELRETLQRPDGQVLELSDEGALDEFRLELGLPVWRYPGLEKRMFQIRGRNATVIAFRASEAMTLRLRPGFQIRPHEGLLTQPPAAPPLTLDGARCVVHAGAGPTLAAHASRGAWRPVTPVEVRSLRYPIEEARGYDATGPLTTPCELTVPLGAGETAWLVVQVEDGAPVIDGPAAAEAELARRTALLAAAPADLRVGLAGELVLAADQFLVRKLGGDEDARTVIAGYHWFTDWGRDTMISLEGLCLTTGRPREAARILRTFAAHVHDGLIPNLFPEGESRGLYHTADATLWFFHAVDRYTQVTGDDSLVRELLPVLRDIVEHHLRGTRFGIGVDAADGLLRQGEPGYQLTWMDAKVGDWVVTPRRGKAVEINALFYNALCLLAAWSSRYAVPAPGIAEAAARLRASFNARFPCRERGHLFDVLDPNDPALRPNQVLAIALPHPVLDRPHWESVLHAVRDGLLTPVGLRSLGPHEPDYKAHYEGDLRTRDAAYHQGTVWAWLIGPFVDAWTKAFPRDDARAFLAGFDRHLGVFGTGSIAEIFDAEPPHAPRGCVAQAWSVAEVLRLLGRAR